MKKRILIDAIFEKEEDYPEKAIEELIEVIRKRGHIISTGVEHRDGEEVDWDK